MKKIKSHNDSYFLYYHLFYIYGKAADKPRVDSSLNPEFILENNLKPIFNPVKFVDSILPVYKKNKGGCQKTYSLLSTE